MFFCYLLFVFLLLPCCSFAHRCVHDQLRLPPPRQNAWLHSQTTLERRKRQSSDLETPQPIRIQLNVDSLQQHACESVGQQLQLVHPPSFLTCTADDLLSAEDVQNITAVLNDLAINYFGRSLFIWRALQTLKTTAMGPGVCGVRAVPATELVDYDLLVIVSAHPTLLPTLAWASPCQQDQLGRPYVGTINIGPAETRSLSSELLRSTLQHEFLHLLGFAASMYSSYFEHDDPVKPRLLADVVQEQTLWEAMGGGKATASIKTPRVVAAAIEHFNCTGSESSSIAVELAKSANEAAGVTLYGSHWAPRVARQSIMSPVAATNQRMDVFTLAFLEDMGFYYIQRSLVLEQMQWLRNEGCEIMTKHCRQWTSSIDSAGLGGELCRSIPDVTCSANRRDVGVCNVKNTDNEQCAVEWMQNNGNSQWDCSVLGGPIHDDACGFVHAVSSCADGNVSFGWLESGGDATALCFMSTSVTVGGEARGRCYRHRCVVGQQLEVFNGDTGEFVPCPVDGGVVALSSSISIVCPPSRAICCGVCENGGDWYEGDRCQSPTPLRNFSSTFDPRLALSQYGLFIASTRSGIAVIEHSGEIGKAGGHVTVAMVAGAALYAVVVRLSPLTPTASTETAQLCVIGVNGSQFDQFISKTLSFSCSNEQQELRGREWAAAGAYDGSLDAFYFLIMIAGEQVAAGDEYLLDFNVKLSLGSRILELEGAQSGQRLVVASSAVVFPLSSAGTLLLSLALSDVYGWPMNSTNAASEIEIHAIVVRQDQLSAFKSGSEFRYFMLGRQRIDSDPLFFEPYFNQDWLDINIVIYCPLLLTQAKTAAATVTWTATFQPLQTATATEFVGVELFGRLTAAAADADNGGGGGFVPTWGFWFLIAFGSLLFVYFILGSLFRRFALDQHGWDVVPQRRLWAALPSLVFDGIRFSLLRFFGCVVWSFNLCRGKNGGNAMRATTTTTTTTAAAAAAYHSPLDQPPSPRRQLAPLPSSNANIPLPIAIAPPPSSTMQQQQQHHQHHMQAPPLKPQRPNFQTPPSLAAAASSSSSSPPPPPPFRAARQGASRSRNQSLNNNNNNSPSSNPFYSSTSADDANIFRRHSRAPPPKPPPPKKPPAPI